MEGDEGKGGGGMEVYGDGREKEEGTKGDGMGVNDL